MKKKLLMLGMVIVVAISFGSCGKADDSVLSKEEVKQMLSNADDFKGRKVEDLPLEVFSIISEDKGNYQYQAWADSNANKSVIFTSTEDLDLSEGDYVLLSGTVSGQEEYETIMGVETSSPLIENSTAKKADATIFNPASSSLKVGETQSQKNVTVTLDKIDFSKNSTRAYITIKNDSSDQITIYSFSCFIKQGDAQFDESEDGYKETTLKSEINAGIKADGCISFEKISDEKAPFTLTLDISSDDYTNRLEPFVFNVTP